MLEPYAVKVASTVLKGLGVSNDLRLLDKYRKKLLFDNDRIEFFKEICLEIGKRFWFRFDAIGTDGDHVHIFVGAAQGLSLIHISEPTSLRRISYAVFCLKKKKK